MTTSEIEEQLRNSFHADDIDLFLMIKAHLERERERERERTFIPTLQTSTGVHID